MPGHPRIRRPAVIIAGALAVVAAAGFAAWAILTVPVTGQSMAPTLAPGNRLIVLPGAGAAVHRFSVIIGRFGPTGPNVVKRVIGLPGDRVAIEKYGDRPGVVRVQPAGDAAWYEVDNPAWAERWQPTADNCCRPDGKADGLPQVQQVPAGMLFVLGDNIGASDDSRVHGWMPTRMVEGRAVARVGPPGLLDGLTSGVTLRPAG